FGHVHRHPARMRFEHGATRDGRLVYVKARLLLDGGAYVSTSPVVVANASYFAAGAYEVPHAEIDGIAVFTNNPPCGAMRGFGAVQSTYGCESNMDRLAAALGMDPLELRSRNAMTTGTVLPTGQAVDGPAPVRELLRSVGDMPLPAEAGDRTDPRTLPGGEREHHPPPGRAPRGRVRGRGQGDRILRGSRRHLDRPRHALRGRRRTAGRRPHRG